MTALGGLIHRIKGDRTIAELADRMPPHPDTGLPWPSTTLLHALATKDLAEEPTDLTVEHLAAGLGVPEAEVMAAIYQDLYADDPQAARARIADRQARRARLFAAIATAVRGTLSGPDDEEL